MIALWHSSDLRGSDLHFFDPMAYFLFESIHPARLPLALPLLALHQCVQPHVLLPVALDPPAQYGESGRPFDHFDRLFELPEQDLDDYATPSLLQDYHAPVVEVA